jgi:soluble lytic murein transglycosylase-like protein
MRKKEKIILWVFLSIMLGIPSTNMFFNLNASKVDPGVETVTVVRYKQFLQREEINDAVKDKINQGKKYFIMNIYADLIGDPSLTHLITSYALEYDIPISLLLSIIYVESSFNPAAVNKNSNGTSDYGLMSLNSRTFKGYTDEQLYDVEINLQLGCEFLVMLKEKYRTWGEAVIHYNGLYTKGAGSYMVKVMEKEREFESLFNDKI